jgi:hypothetical protein
MINDGSDKEFGPDTEAIRSWLRKRATYTSDDSRHRGTPTAVEPVADAPPARPPLHASPPPVLAADSGPAAEPVAAARKAPPVGRSMNATFTPGTGVRRAMGLVLLTTLGATGPAAWFAATEPSTGTIGIAGTLGLLSLVVWGVRAGSAKTTVVVRRGRLEVRRDDALDSVDLASRFTPVQIVGRPGHRGWKVLIERPDLPVLRIDGSLVDPRDFTDLLLRLRPDLREDAPARAPEPSKARQPVKHRATAKAS